MATHNAPLAHIAYQQPDGTTGVLDPHDVLAMHNDPNVVKTENIEDRAVTNGKIAAGAVTEVELADGAVTQEKLAEDVWDSISQRPKIAYEDVEIAINPVTDVNASNQPNAKILSPKNVTAQNFLGRQLIKVWPRSTWTVNGAQVMVAMSYGTADWSPFNQACFTSNCSQVYDLVVRFWYWVE